MNNLTKHAMNNMIGQALTIVKNSLCALNPSPGESSMTLIKTPRMKTIMDVIKTPPLEDRTMKVIKTPPLGRGLGWVSLSWVSLSWVVLGWFFLVGLLFFLPLSCANSEFEYSNNSCFFVFDNAQHNDPTLTSALIATSPGTFCRIYTKPGKKYGFESNRGLSSEVVMNREDELRTRILGISSSSGIIVGYGNLSGELYAFDALCPNCYEDLSAQHTLSMSDIGFATCNTCKRIYDMNNGGIVTENGKGGDRKMKRYHCSYNDSGTSRVLKVNN